MPSRRAALHAVGGVLLAGGGCLGTAPGGRTQRTDTTGTTTTEPAKRTGSPQRTPVSLPSRDVDGATVAVGQPAVRRSFVYRPAVGTGGVVAGDDQYLLVAARGDEGARTPTRSPSRSTTSTTQSPGSTCAVPRR